MAEKTSPGAEDVEFKIASADGNTKDAGIAGTAGTSENELAEIQNDQRLLHRRSAKTSSPAETFRDRRRVRKDKLDTGQLPTPPPDPIPTGNIFEEAFTKHKAHLEAEALRKEGEFLDYLIGLPTPSETHTPSLSRSTSAFAASLGTEDAFDHLDRLYILMEQVLNLREQNSKLSRRVRELERLRALKSAHREAERAVLTGEDLVLSEEDAGFAESLLGAMLSAGTDVCPRRNFCPPMSRQRSRSIGVDTPVLLFPESNRSYGNLSSAKRRVSGMNGAPKVSKWTKVKAAFKWERAYTGGTGESEIAKHLKIPENVDTANALGSSGSRMAELSAPPTPDTLSSASSIDDISHAVRKSASNHSSHLSSQVKEDTTDDDPTRRSRSLDGDVSTLHSSMFSAHTAKDNAGHRKMDKGHKTPWGKVKDMIYLRRESLRRQPARSSIRSEDGYSISSLESSEILQELQGECGRPRIQITSESPTLSLKPSSPESDVVDLATRRLTPTLTITVPSSEELRSISSPESISPPPTLLPDSAEERSPSEELETSKNVQTSANLPPTYPQFAVARSRTCQDVLFSSAEFRRQRSGKSGSLASSPKMQRHDSKWNKVKKAFLTNTNSVPPSPSKITSFFDDTDGLESYSASAEDLENDPTNPNIQAEIQRNYQLLHDKLSAEFYRKLTEWEKLKSTSQAAGQQAGSHDFSFRPWSSARERDSMNLQILGEEQLTPEFKKKLQEWKRIKKGPHSPTISEHQAGRRRITDWQLWRSSSKPETKSEAEHNRPHLSEDFIKKMEEWKRIKAYRIDDDQQEPGTSVGGSTAKQSKGWKTPEEKEFQSLMDRDLSKVDREQQKIERQREKFLDREARLSMLRRVVGSSPQKKEVLVHTSTGYYRFEGISRKFTRKLYEWEKSQGIAPELSTFRLLNPSYRSPAEVTSINTTHERGSRQVLKRSKSVGSMVDGSTKSETPIRQPSSLSLNDMEELEAECMAADSQLGSEPTIAEEATDDIVLDDSEPEAMIVDIEDVIEETASPMVQLQPHQTPIYSVAASETTSIAVPLGTVTASHEPSPVILMEAGEIHPMTTRVTVKESRNENLTLSSEIKDAGIDVANESPSGSSGSMRSSTQLINSEWKQDYLCVLNEMHRNEKKLRELEADNTDVEESLRACEASNVERSTERQDSLGEIAGVKQIDVLFTKENNLKESFTSTLQQQTNLCQQLLKKTLQLEEFDSNKTMQLVRWVKELESTLTRRYNEDLQHKEVSSSLDNVDTFCSIGEKGTTGISACHRQRAEKLLTTIRDVAVEMFELKENRSSQGDSKSKMIKVTTSKESTSRTPKRRIGKSADNKDSGEPTKNNICRTERFSENEQTFTDERSSNVDKVAAVSARKRSNTRRQSSTDDDETIISVDKDSRKKTILQTRRHTDIQTVGYERPSEEPEDPDNGHVYSEPTFRTAPLTVSIFRDSPDVERIIINENTLNKIVVRTANTAEPKAQELTSSAHSSNRNSGNFSDSQDSPVKKEKNGPRSVFVKTKRIIFSPFRRDSKGKATSCNNVDVKNDSKILQASAANVSNYSTNPDLLVVQSARSLKANDRSNSESPRAHNRSKHDPILRVCEVTGRPPLPQSPVLARKDYHKSSPKETAPSIRMMIQRYNQKLEDAAGSPASSGSGSPIWRSPSSERRVRMQMERYQEEVRKAITGPLQVQKSASTSVIRDGLAKSSVVSSRTAKSGTADCSGQVREISKSSSADFIGSEPSRSKRIVVGTKDDTKNDMARSDKLSPALVHKLTALSTAVAQREGRCSIASSSSERSSSYRSVRDTNGVRLEESADQSSLKLRALKIQRAKEDFLSRGPGCYSHDPDQIDRIGDVGSKSRTDSLDAGISRSDLIKSASAGMINVDPDTYERLSLNRGCESLPRPAKRRGESSGRFSQIASKFRRARMRRAKDKDGKMSTISMLCRQSLLVDIQTDETSKSCPSTPALQRDEDDYSWLKKPRDSS